MTSVPFIFFGSSENSVQILDTLHNHPFNDHSFELSAIITQPPRPVGRKKILTPTPVEKWGRTHNATVLSFPSDPQEATEYADKTAVIDTINAISYDLLIAVSYGQLIPWEVISAAKYGGLNVHPSLLPRWRGADPIPWTLLTRDRQTGVTVVTLSKSFDEGRIIAQKKISIDETEMRLELRKKLFTLGSTLLASTLESYITGDTDGSPQDDSRATYARRLRRKDGYLPWPTIRSAFMSTTPSADAELPKTLTASGDLKQDIYTLYRALSPWPGLWTEVMHKGVKKRLKILEMKKEHNSPIITTVQLEGKTPVPMDHALNVYDIGT